MAYVTEGKRPPIYDADNPAPYTYGAYMQKLTPATEYEYRIVNADGATDWITFSTTKEYLNKYKVLVFRRLSVHRLQRLGSDGANRLAAER